MTVVRSFLFLFKKAAVCQINPPSLQSLPNNTGQVDQEPPFYALALYCSLNLHAIQLFLSSAHFLLLTADCSTYLPVSPCLPHAPGLSLGLTCLVDMLGLRTGDRPETVVDLGSILPACSSRMVWKCGMQTQEDPLGYIHAEAAWRCNGTCLLNEQQQLHDRCLSLVSPNPGKQRWDHPSTGRTDEHITVNTCSLLDPFPSKNSAAPHIVIFLHLLGYVPHIHRMCVCTEETDRELFLNLQMQRASNHKLGEELCIWE